MKENEAPEKKLSWYTRVAVESSAMNAAKENRTPREACPYRMDFAPLEYMHWHAVFALNGGYEPPLEAMVRINDELGIEP